MNRSLEVCLIGLSLIAGVVAVGPGAAQTLQKGVSVVMAPTTNAIPMSEADNESAWIVTVVRDGTLYFGTDQVTVARLEEKMKVTPRNRQAKLYIKADARAHFADVERVLQVGKAMLFESAVLLTSQPEQPAPGKIVPPKGLEVLVGATHPAEAIILQVLNHGEPKPTVLVDNADVSIDVLQNTLGRMLRNRHSDVVVLKADGSLAFAQVARVIDACRGAGVKVVVEKPEV